MDFTGGGLQRFVLSVFASVSAEKTLDLRKNTFEHFFGLHLYDSENKVFKKLDFVKVNNSGLISRTRGRELKVPSVQL